MHIETRRAFASVAPRRQEGDTTRKRAWVPAAFAALVILALACRLPDIGTAPFWTDEIASWSFIQLPVSDLLGAMARVEPNPPGHYLLLKAVAGIFGDGEAALRLPSVLAGALAVLPLAAVATRIGGVPAGLMTALLLALSAIQIHHAQQARGYAVLFLAAAMALWLIGRLLDPAARALLATMAGFVAACLVMIHLHATATLTVAAIFGQAGVVVAARAAWGERPQRRTLVALAVAAVLIPLGSAWWLARALDIAADPGSAVSWIERPGLGDSAIIVADVLGGFHLGRLKFLAGVLMAALLGLGAAIAVRRRSAEALGLAAGFALNLLALHGPSQIKPMMLERTALVLLVFALPLAGYAVSALRPRSVAIALGVLVTALALRGASNGAAEFAGGGFGEDWRGAVAALARQAAPGDLVVMLNPPDSGALPHYAPGLAEQLRLRSIWSPADRMGVELLARLPFVQPLAQGEGCGGPAWTLARETRWELAAIAAWPPSDAAQRFGGVVLRRRALPDCQDGKGV
jgi:mannosyltransferase